MGTTVSECSTPLTKAVGARDCRENSHTAVQRHAHSTKHISSKVNFITNTKHWAPGSARNVLSLCRFRSRHQLLPGSSKVPLHMSVQSLQINVMCYLAAHSQGEMNEHCPVQWSLETAVETVLWKGNILGWAVRISDVGRSLPDVLTPLSY